MRQVSFTPASVRTIAGRLVVKQRLPEFSEYLDDSLEIYAHDCCIRNGEIFRAVCGAPDEATPPTLQTEVVSEPKVGFTDTGVGLFEGSGLSLSENYIFIHKADGTVVKRSIADGSETPLFANAYPVGIAAVSDTEYYVLRRVSVYQYQITYYVDAVETDLWHGSVYGERSVPGMFDSVRLNGVDYIAYQTDGGLNARIVKRENGLWSDSDFIYPLDVVDNTSQFRLGGLSVIDGRLVVVGVISRNNYKVKIYTIGPDHFSHGREWFIAEGYHADYSVTVDGSPVVLRGNPGKMLLLNDVLYVFGGDHYYHKATATVLFGSDVIQAEVPFDNLTFEGETNRPGRVNISVPGSVDEPLLAPGNILEYYATVNGVEVKMGTFSIGTVEEVEDGIGDSFTVVARSLASKYLATWNSDSSFDYWSQTKQIANAAELGEILRGQGEWEEVEDYLTLKSFNHKGILYTSQRSTRNHAVVGEFNQAAESGYSTRYGVAAVYYRETPQDAAERLGEDFARDIDCVNYGFFFVADSSDHSLNLYLVADTVWTLLASGPTVDLSADWHKLRIAFHEGQILCSYKIGNVWTHAITYQFTADTEREKPWFKDEVGKAALYIENVTANAPSYQFGSTDTLIPVDDNSPFPTTDIVIVNDELIRYEGKSPNRKSEELTWASGKTYQDAPHENPYDMPIQLTTAIEGPSAYYTTAQYYLMAESFVASDDWKVSYVELYLQKVGSPGSLDIIIASDDYDNYGAPAASAILAQVNVSPSNTAAGWVTVTFPGVAPNTYNDAYFLAIIRRGTHDAANHYRIYHRPSLGRSRYLYRTNNGSVWTTHSSINMCLRVYGHGSTLPGHEIYFEGVGDPAHDPEYFSDCALVITEGPGAGRAYRVTGYDYDAPWQWEPVGDTPNGENFVGVSGYGSWVDYNLRRVFVAEQPSRVFTDETKAIIVPSLKISQRGIVIDDLGVETVDETTVAAHPAGTCSIYRQAFASVRGMEYFSGERDWTLEEMIREIAARANALDVSAEKKLSGSDVGTGVTPDMATALANAFECESAIVDFEVSSWGSGGGVGLAVFPPEEGDYSTIQDVAVVVHQGHIDFYQGEVLIETFSLPEDIAGRFTISFQKTSFSIWNGGRFICHFPWAESHAEDPELHVGFRVGVVTAADVAYSVTWSELDSRVDNYILDIGQSGHALLASLIGEKRVYYFDDPDGNLRLFRTYQVINPGAPMDLRIQGSVARSDLDLRTRLRVEGAEIVETADMAALAKYGNLFKMIGLREPNNIVEAMREALLVMDDSLRTYSRLPFVGPADPRVEPGDIIEVSFPDGARDILVRTVGFQMMINREEALFDMSISGEEYVA